MPLDPAFGQIVFEVTSTIRELQQDIGSFLEDPSVEGITFTREQLQAISNMLLVSSEIIPGLYEENQTIIDRLKVIEEKINKL